MEHIKAKIQHIFEQKLGIDKHKLQATTNLQELNLDEIDVVMLTICLEDAFEIMIDDEQFAQLQTMDEIYQFISQQIEQHEKHHSAANP